nr:hypothetical protein [Tanacetum cinerariifolium]
MAQENQQQPCSDEDLVPMDDRVKISINNFRIAPEKKQKEPIYQLTLDILKQYPFYNALTKTADVPEIYMQQFWHTVAENTRTQTYHFMIDDQQFEVGAESFRDVFQITPRVPNQDFVEPPRHDDLVSFIKQLGYSGSLDVISNMYIDYMHQPWRAFMTIINKCLTGKSSGFDRPRQSMIQILWGMFNNKNVDYANLIWEDFKYQIDCRVSNAKKKELLPYSRFTKIIINHILSKHNNLSKRPESWTHTIEYDSVLGNLKFVRKGEGHPKYGTSIPDVMMSDTIRNSAHYMKYLANSTGTESSVPTVGKRQGKGSMSKKDAVRSKSRRLHERHTSLVISREVTQEADKGADDHPKKKLKGVATECDVAQSLLKLKEVIKATRNEYILKKIPKGPGEGDTPVDYDHDKSNWGSDEEVEVISHDERTETETDVSENAIVDTVMSTSPAKTTQSPKPKSPQSKTKKLLKKPMKPEKKVDVKAVLQRLMKLEKKVDAMSKVHHTDAIEKSVKAHLMKESPKVVPDFDKIKQVSAAKKNVPRNSPKSSTTTSDSDSVKEYDLKDELFQLMTKSKSFKTHPSHQKLYDALMESLLVDEDNFDKQYDIQPTLRKRHHEDQDPRERRVTRSISKKIS